MMTLRAGLYPATRGGTAQAFFALSALADAPRHGYGIVREVAELSQGRVQLKIGGLYGVLDRLAAEQLIEPDREEAHDGPLRRYYRLTRTAWCAGRGGRPARLDRPRGLGEAGPAGYGTSRMSGDLDLEQRYRRVLRLLPSYYPANLGTGHGRCLPRKLADRRPG